jgi:hypothetical protein
MGRSTRNRRTKSTTSGGVTTRTTYSYGKNGPRTTYSTTSRSLGDSSMTTSSSYSKGKNRRSSTYNDGHGRASIWSSSSGGGRRGRKTKASFGETLLLIVICLIVFVSVEIYQFFARIFHVLFG